MATALDVPDTPSTPAYRVRDRLRREIEDGTWPAGTHQTLAQLSARHSSSLSPVREALLHLQGEGSRRRGAPARR